MDWIGQELIDFLQITSWSVWWLWTSTPAWTSTWLAWLGCGAQQQGAGQGQGGEGGCWGGGAQTWNTWLGRHSNTGTASFQASKPPAPYNPPDFYLFLLARCFFRNLFFFPRFLQHVLFFKLLQLPAALLFLVPDFLSGFFGEYFLWSIFRSCTVCIYLPACHVLVYFLTFLDF